MSADDDGWGRLPVGMRPEPSGPGRESVWSFPRPAIAEPTAWRLRIVHRGETVAETLRGVRTLETSHPPTYYFPREDVGSVLVRAPGESLCEWKGRAVYFDVQAAGETLAAVAWGYPSPTPAFAALKDHVAFYAARFDACFVDDEQVTAQPGGFYGGWITSHVAGPFKGGPDSRLW